MLWPKFRVLQVYGANTGIGKTIFSSILCRAFEKRLRKVYYLKPVSTGPLEDADDRYVNLITYSIKISHLYMPMAPCRRHVSFASC